MSMQISSLQKPAIVLVPGTFHTPTHFQPLSERFQRLSYPTHTVALPSIGEEAATATLQDDINAIRSPLERFVDDGKEVVLVLHSYSGIPGCQTVKGLEKTKRAEEGNEGGVIQVLFMAAFLPQEGQNVTDALGGASLPWSKADGSLLYPKNTPAAIYNHLSIEEAEHYTSLLQPQSATTWTTPVKDTCYDLNIDITYLYCDDDLFRGVLQHFLEKVKKPSWIVQRIKGDHCPFLSSKEAVVRAVEMCLD